MAAVMSRDIWKLSVVSFQHSAKSLLVVRNSYFNLLRFRAAHTAFKAES
jgi:hypothetical protein